MNQCPHDVIFDRADGNAKSSTDLKISQFIDAVQQKDLARSRREFADSIAIPAVQVLHFEPFLLGGIGCRERCLVQRDEIGWSATRTSRSIGDEISNDAVEIGFGRSLDLFMTKRSQSLERILYDVGYIIGVAHVPA